MIKLIMVLRGILIKRVLKRVENGTGEQRFWRAAKSQFLQLIRYFEMLLHICAIISQPQNVMTKTPILGQWYQARNARVCFYLWEQKISQLTSTATSHNWIEGSPSCKRQDDLQSWKLKEQMMPQVGGGGRRGCLPLRVRPHPADDDTSSGHRLPGVVVALWKRAQRIDFPVQALYL